MDTSKGPMSEATKRTAPLPPALLKRMEDQIKAWRDDLINLNRNNRLVFFKPSKVSTLEISEPGISDLVSRLQSSVESGLRILYTPLEPGDPLQGVEVDGRSVRVPLPDQPSMERRLRDLARRASQEYLDRGLWIMYLGVGFLEWVDNPDPSHPTGEKVLSPLLMFPVEIRRNPSSGQFRLHPVEEDVALNPALSVKLSNDFDLDFSLPEEVDESDVKAVLSHISRVIKDRPGWSIKDRAVLSFFSFVKEWMYRDLEKNADTVAAHSVVQALGLKGEAETRFEFEPVPLEAIDQRASSEEIISILDSDSSQRQAIAAAREGRSFVMDGPPGTGKSQTISNIIADLLSRGKTVLFVSEKAAALEVVYKRLVHAGLDDYVLELHSHKVTRKDVAKRIGKSLQYWPSAKGRSSIETLENLRIQREKLSHYADALNKKRFPLGLSLQNVLGRISRLHHLPQPPPSGVAPKDMNPLLFAEIASEAESLADAWGPVSHRETFRWLDYAGPAFNAGERFRIQELLQGALKALGDLRSASESFSSKFLLPLPKVESDVKRLADLEDLLRERPPVPPHWFVMDHGKIRGEFDQFNKKACAYKSISEKIQYLAGPNWRALDPKLRGKVNVALDVLRTTFKDWFPGEDKNLREFSRLTSFFSTAHSNAKEIGEVTRGIQRLLGGGSREWTLAGLAELSEIALLAKTSTRPEERWVEPDIIVELETVVLEAGPLLRNWREHHETIQEVFGPGIQSVNLEALCIRFEKTHRGPFRWFSPLYWKDRKEILPHCITGRFGKFERENLRSALASKKASVEVFNFGKRNENLLGSTYWKGTETNWAALHTAFSIAKRLTDFGAKALDLKAVRIQFARGGRPDPELIPLAERISHLFDAWTLEGKKVIPNQIHALSHNQGLQAVVDSLEELNKTFTRLVSPFEEGIQAIDSDLPLGQFREALNLRSQLEEIEQWFDAMQPRIKEIFGSCRDWQKEDWASQSDALDWVARVCKAMDGDIGPPNAERLSTEPLAGPLIVNVLMAWVSNRREVSQLFRQDNGLDYGRSLNAGFDLAESHLIQLKDSIDEIGSWQDYIRAKKTLLNRGLGTLVEFCISKSIPADQVPQIITRSLLEGWADSVLAEDPDLIPFMAEDRDRIVKRFQTLDREVVATASSRVIEACNARRPTSMAGGASLILREAEKQRKHIATRKLMENAGHIVQALKPCFMMSPLSVSQFLPTDMRFDVVIFDEASQVRPPDAINAIYRGDSLIIAGDQKQMPPTSFFDRAMADGEEEDEEEFDTFESVLDLCKGSASFTSLPLRWHYRSRHEDLITYSNYSFYKGLLVTFPSAQQEAQNLGVEFIHVPNGIYRRGASRDNEQEARKVVERVRFHCEKHAEATIGVVAFSEAQASLIDRLLQSEARECPELNRKMGQGRLDGLFVKNLETVQGDERDIIIFSIGYGRDEAGKFSTNFGPINKAMGWRRLNVAITRARDRVEVVASIRHEDFPSGISNEGVHHLKRYLDFASRKENKTSALAMELSSEGRDTESPFEEEVARVLHSWAYQIVPQVGCAEYRIDVGVRHPKYPSSFMLGIECDGAMYHSSRVARDRDRLRQEVLEGLGWCLFRIWGPSWYRNRSEQEGRLREALMVREKEVEFRMETSIHPPFIPSATWPEAKDYVWEQTKQKIPIAPISLTPEPKLIDLNAKPAWVHPYTWSPSPMADQSMGKLHDPSSRQHLEAVLCHAITQEGPIHFSRLIRRAKEAWGYGRAGNPVRDAVQEVVNRLLRQQMIRVVDREFYSYLFKPTIVRTPVEGDPETFRTIEEVSPEELYLAGRTSVMDARAIQQNDLCLAIARLFGWERVGGNISDRLALVLDRLRNDKSIGIEGSQFLWTSSPES